MTLAHGERSLGTLIAIARTRVAADLRTGAETPPGIKALALTGDKRTVVVRSKVSLDEDGAEPSESRANTDKRVAAWSHFRNQLEDAIRSSNETWSSVLDVLVKAGLHAVMAQELIAAKASLANAERELRLAADLYDSATAGDHDTDSYGPNPV